MRCVVVAFACAAACAGRIETGATGDASAGMLDAASAAIADDGAAPADRAPASADAAAPVPDLRECPDRKTSCLAVECGMVPDGCGEVLDCGPCGMPGEVCIRTQPIFVNPVRQAVNDVVAAHPEYFDLNDPKNGCYRVVAVADYRSAVLARLTAAGANAIADVNDPYEIRIKSGNSAENYRLVILGGYCGWYYTSTCTPAGF